MEQDLKDFIKQFEAKSAPLIKQVNLAYFNATISGKEDDYKLVNDLQIKLSDMFSNKEDFGKLKHFKESPNIVDSLLLRQLDVLYSAFLSSQIDEVKRKTMINLSTNIEQMYSTFRAEINNKKVSDNDIEDLLTNSTNSKDLEAAWRASKKVGAFVADSVIKLVRLRNEVAKELGFNNYHQMSLILSEQKPEEINAIFDELDKFTTNLFVNEKDIIDNYFAKRYKVDKKDLMPWHYQNRFFQEAPKIYDMDLDVYFKDKDLVALTSNYYKSINLDVDDIIKRSDLFEKPGKNQHAYCTDIDNEGDVRVLCNVKPNYKWMNTMLHEFGHSAYDKYIDIKLPYYLREPAHIFTTEAIAMMFGHFASSPQWLKDMLNISDIEANKIKTDCFNTLKLEQLVFSRWSQVMYRFEKAMYENPEQDLNKLWWDLVEKYQMIKKPVGRNEPDWASKIHIATSPCYYHNYQLGELFACQLSNYIIKNIIKSDDLYNQSFYNNPAVGAFLIDKVFKPGKKYYWNEMIQKATGEKLTSKYFALQFENK
ncbi:MAG: M2 family metallopeptidase [Bacteroidales bacterium]|nr:M2 family metallopeptidase [Bacteroidales bacterium]